MLEVSLFLRLCLVFFICGFFFLFYMGAPTGIQPCGVGGGVEFLKRGGVFFGGGGTTV